MGGKKDFQQALIIQLTRLDNHFHSGCVRIQISRVLAANWPIFNIISLSLQCSHTDCDVVIPPGSRKYPAYIVCHMAYVLCPRHMLQPECNTMGLNRKRGNKMEKNCYRYVRHISKPTWRINAAGPAELNKKKKKALVWYVITVYSIWTPPFKSSNLSHFSVIWALSLGRALRRYITAVRGGIPLRVPVPLLSSHCHRMVKIALSLIESKYGEVIELGFFLQPDGTGLQYIG